MITTFGHQYPDVVISIWELTAEIFYHLSLIVFGGIHDRKSYTERNLKELDKTK